MSSPRKHPSRYPQRLIDLLLGPSISVSFATKRQAARFRYQLYAFRESLREHPDHAPILLRHANTTTLKVKGSTLLITKSEH